MKRLYFDWAASAPRDPAIMEVVRSVEEEYVGNPSSVHVEGKRARMKLEECRERIAPLLGASSGELIFTSGGTESNSLVFLSQLAGRSRGGVLLGGFEHPSVWNWGGILRGMGLEVREISSSIEMPITPERVVRRAKRGIRFISIMAVNNETGARTRIRELVEACREVNPSPLFHTDAVQALGKEPIDLASWGVDSASFSGHKIGAPRGVGLLYLRKGSSGIFARGGGQEGGVRGGTENLGGVYGLTLALEKWCGRMAENLQNAREVKCRLVEGVSRIRSARFVPSKGLALSDEFSPYILSVAFPPIPGEVLLRALDSCGVAVATGAACASRDSGKNRVLVAQGVPEESAKSTIRLSWGPETGLEEVDALLKVLEGQIVALGVA